MVPILSVLTYFSSEEIWKEYLELESGLAGPLTLRMISEGTSIYLIKKYKYMYLHVHMYLVDHKLVCLRKTIKQICIWKTNVHIAIYSMIVCNLQSNVCVKKTTDFHTQNRPFAHTTISCS